MSKPILALNSSRGKSGKDTLIDHIEARLNLRTHRVAFADILKREVASVLAHDSEIAKGIEKAMHTSGKDKPFTSLALDSIPRSPYKDWLKTTGCWLNRYAPRTPRWHAQVYGTEFIREHCQQPDRWLNLGVTSILDGLLDPSVDLVVVTDMRLPNEHDELVRMGAKTVRIARDWYIPEVDAPAPHVSDTALDGYRFDAFITNRHGNPAAMVDQLISQGVL